MDLASQTVLVRAYVTDWVKKNPVPEAELQARNTTTSRRRSATRNTRSATSSSRRKTRRRTIIAELQKGEKFDELAKARSKDPGSKDKGGDLDWNAPGELRQAVRRRDEATPKGKFTAQPVQTQFGWHVIEVEDVRDAKVRRFDEVKPQLQQRLQAQWLDKYFKDLRAKNGM